MIPERGALCNGGILGRVRCAEWALLAALPEPLRVSALWVTIAARKLYWRLSPTCL